jgi:hypothetical protein
VLRLSRAFETLRGPQKPWPTVSPDPPEPKPL